MDSHKTTNHNLFEEKGEPKRYRTEALPLTSLTARPNRLTGTEKVRVGAFTLGRVVEGEGRGTGDGRGLCEESAGGYRAGGEVSGGP